MKKHGLQISSKSIYNFIKSERSELKKHLAPKGKPPRQRVVRRRNMFETGVPSKKNIHNRPSITGPGNWEVDTVVSKKGSKEAVLTLRELGSKKRFYFKIKDLKSKTVNDILLPFFQQLPKHMRNTLTSDNGSEFAKLYKLEKVVTELSVYYCDPYKAWQRGSVENANGELRRYFPKKTDFSTVTEKLLKKVEKVLNWKPMKVNDYISAETVFYKDCELA